MLKLKSLMFISVTALCGIGLFSQAVFSHGRAPKFTSAYTDLKTQCKNVSKKVGEGQDVPLRCQGYGGYEVRIDFSAASSHFRVEPRGNQTEDSIDLAAQPVGYDQKRKIEWRMADGKPFAVIFRVDKSKSNDPTEMWRPENIMGQFLLIKGLKGYEHINFEVDAKDPNANVKAREMADNAYTKGRASSEDDKIDLFGYYSLDGRVPKELQEIEVLHLSTITDRRGKIVKVPLYGFFRLNKRRAPDIYLVNPTLKGKEFTFSTKTVRGVRYQFSGQFTKLGNFPVNRPEGEVVLTGRLTKYRNRKKVFTGNVKFSYSGGD